MPSSNFGHLSDVLSSVILINPKTILEIGVGFGKYGFLFREYLDLAYDEQTRSYQKWKRVIDGIEINSNYLTPVHNYIYNNIYIGNALDILSQTNKKYDSIVAVDIIEHFTKSDGYKFINKALNISDNIVLATPYIYLYYQQGEVFGNKNETHLSGWDYSDFINSGAKYLWKKGINLIAVYSEKDLPLPLAENIKIPDLTQSDLQNMMKLIFMYFNTNQYKQCMDCCLHYLKYYKNDLRVLSIYAETLDKTGERERALEVYTQILRIDPINITIKENIAEYNNNIKISPLKRDFVLLFKGGFQYNVVNYFIDDLALGFQKLGLKTKIIDLMEKDSTYNTEKYIFNENVKFMFSFNGIGVPYLINLAEVTKVPLITFYLDSPIYHYNRLQYKSDFLKILYMDKNDVKFLNDIFGLEATFMPHGAVTLFGEKERFQQKHNIIFAGSIEEPQIYREKWSQQGKIIKKFFDNLLEYLLNREYFNIKPDIDFILNENGIELNNTQKNILYQNAVFVHKFIRNYRRIKILGELKEFEIDIYGNGWDKFTTSKKHKIHQGLDFNQLIEECKKSKLLLNVLPEFVYGGHERIFTSMYYGTPVLTNSNYYLKSIFENNKDIIFYSWKKRDELPEIISRYLDNEDKLSELSASGYDKIQKSHTWFQRAKEILLLIDKK